MEPSTEQQQVDALEVMHDVSPLHESPASSKDASSSANRSRLSATASSVQIPPEVHSSHSVLADAGISDFSRRLFLDICCGVQSPLSSALHLLKGDVLRFDILLHELDDLLTDRTYESLLRVCASGLIAYAGASPSCCEYSRLKLRPGGPPALRTPEYLQGKPDLSGDQLLKVQESNMMLERCVQCLRLVNSAGGHSHLEQPHTAMSWQEPVVQQYIEQESCSCVCIAACGYGKDWLKTWMLAATYSEISQLACACTHPQGSHQQIAGAISSSGQFLSRDTAEYPAPLAAEFARIVLPLLTTHGDDLDLVTVQGMLPVKDISSPPFARQDGGGFPSQADWSTSHNFSDCFQVLRKNFFKQIMQDRLDQVILRAFQDRQDQPPFSPEQLAPFKVFMDEYLMAQGLVPNWTVPPDQNLCLHILQHMCVCMGDPDVHLFQYLIDGVPLGIHEKIAPSGCFPVQPHSADFDPPLLTVHHTNWSSAEDDPETVQQLINKEVEAGWVEIFPGTMEEAQQFFQHGLAVGRLGLALSQ